MEKENDTLKKYRRRVVKHRILQSLIYGVIIGCGVAFVTAFITWFTTVNGLWLSLGLGAAATAASTALIYFLKLKPEDKDVARRVDMALDLKERAVTMVEFSGDESYIAARQRTDAKEQLERGNVTKIKFGITALCAVLLAVFGVFGSAMTTVTALSAYGIIPRGGQVVDGIVNNTRPDEYSIEYIVEDEECGYIIGEELQIVAVGESGEKVTAEAKDGYMFIGWDDGLNAATRFDTAENQDLTLVAMFAEVQDEQDQGEGDEGEGDKPGDQPSEGDSDSPSSSAGSPAEDNGANNVIDGETYYKLVYDEYYQIAMQYLAEHDDIPEYLREIIEAYFAILA